MTTKVNLKQLKYVASELQAELKTGKLGPAHDMVEKWGARYLAFTQKRYLKMSKGGWAPLAPSTVKKKGKKKSGILINQGHMVKAGLKQGGHGNLFDYIPNGVRVGYSSDTPHPHAKNGFTYGEIAKANETGAGNLPVRTIFVEPDTKTVNGMHQDVKTAIAALGKKAQI